MAETLHEQAPPQIVIGTAGHVDHGKSTLVRALTGTDPDRLPQERQRGLSIELGFAFLPGAEQERSCDLAFVDCPGHARFLRHAIAGMGAMNGCLLVVAADEGVAQQTREHLELLRLLDLAWGRVVLSKVGLVDAARRQALIGELGELVRGTALATAAPLATDAMAGTGLVELRDWLFDEAEARLAAAPAPGTPRLAVDRVFSIAGHGTVCTGTLLGGSIAIGDELAAHPGPSGRVRGLQVRSLAVRRALPGQRTAVNLAGVEREAIARGAWLAPPGSLHGSTCIDILLRPTASGCRHGDPVRVHHGAAVVAGRIILLAVDQTHDDATIAQLRLEEPLYLGSGEQLVLRRPSPAATVGAATVLAVDAPRHKRKRDETRRWFAALQGGPVQRLLSWLEQQGMAPVDRPAAERFCGGAARLDEALRGAGVGVVTRRLARGPCYWSAAAWQRVRRNAGSELAARAAAHPEDPWLPLDRLRDLVAPDCSAAAWEDHLGDWLASGGLLRRERRICAPGLLEPLPSGLQAEAEALLALYREEGSRIGYDHPVCAARPDPALAGRALQAAAAAGWLIALSDRQHWHRGLVAAQLADLRQAFAAGERVDLPWAKARWGLSRRQLLPFLDWCERCDLTRRQGDDRLAGPRLADIDDGVPAPLLRELPPADRLFLQSQTGSET